MKQCSIIPFFLTTKYVRLLGLLASLFSLGLHVQAEDLCGRAQLCVYSNLARIFSFDEANPQRELANTVLICTGDSSLALEWTEEHFPSYHSAYGLDSTPLHRAIREGDRDLALRYVTEGLFTNVRESSSRGGTASEGQGYTPLGLLIAGKNSRFSSFGRNKLVNALLVAGADPNALMSLDADPLSVSGEVPLYYAVRVLEDRELVRMLLDAGADPESPALQGKGTPLHWLAIAGDVDRIHELGLEGADVDASYQEDGSGDVPMEWAIRFRSHAGFVALLAGGANLSQGFGCSSRSDLLAKMGSERYILGYGLLKSVLELQASYFDGEDMTQESLEGWTDKAVRAFEILMDVLLYGEEGIPEWMLESDPQDWIEGDLWGCAKAMELWTPEI